MKINTNQNLTNLNSLKKVKTGTEGGLPKESVILGQTEKFDDMQSLKDMAKELDNVKSNLNEVTSILKLMGVMIGVPLAVTTAIGGVVGYAVGGGLGTAIGAGIGATAGIAGMAAIFSGKKHHNEGDVS